jgi:hypothetical protein
MGGKGGAGLQDWGVLSARSLSAWSAGRRDMIDMYKNY